MQFARLSEWAEGEVSALQETLPEDIRSRAAMCPVLLREAHEVEEGDELLGVFEGTSYLEGIPHDPLEAPRITLVIDNLWLEADRNPERFLEEVRVTYLHELGHYMGLDEEEVERMGLL
jgi:predicted Zn-dependent protease with MMP-like domain